MNNWIRYIRAAAGMGVVWAIGGALVGGMIELAANLFPGLQFDNAVDMWIQLLAIIGFLGGAAFSVVLRIAARKRKFEELSLPQFALWGALGGMALGALFAAAGLAGVLFIPPLAIVSAGAASGTLAIARLAQKPALPAATGEE